MKDLDADIVELLIQLAVTLGCFAFLVLRKPRFWSGGALLMILLALGASAKWLLWSNLAFAAMRAASQVNSAGFKVIDEDLRLDGAASEGNRLIFIYTLYRLNHRQIDKLAWEKEVVPRVRKAAANEPKFLKAKQAGILLSARFYSADRILVDEIALEEAVILNPALDAFREFENRNGVKIRARLIGFDGSSVTIEREGGGIFTNPIEIYSDANQRYIRKQVL